MNNKKALLSIALAFVLLIGGASVLYSRLGRSVGTEQMIVHAEETAAAAPGSETARQESGSEAADAPAPPKAISAPDFTVLGQDGSEVKLSQYFGKPIVLNFWASWCGPCQMEMPDFNRKYIELGDEVHFVMINMTDGGRETIETASDFIERNGYEFPILFDTTGEAAMTYGAYSLPTSFFINAQGHVIAQASGPINGELLQKGIDMIANG